MDVARVRDAVEKSGGKLDVAAGLLGKPRRSLDRWISKHGLREEVRASSSRKGVGGRPAGQGGSKRRPRIVPPDPQRCVRVERECEGGDAFISFRDAGGNMATLKFSCSGGGSTKGDGRGRLAELIQKSDGRSQAEFIAAEIQASSADERKRRMCLEKAIARVCGPVVAAQIHEEAKRCV